MNSKVIVTCAVTGSGDTVDKHPAIPVTAQQIGDAALQAADAGAAIVHCHVRDVETRRGVRDVGLYRQVVEHIRSQNTDVIINLTAGMGGDLMIGDGERPRDFDEELTDLVGPVERLLHVAELRPEICTLDCGSLNFGDTHSVVIQTPIQLREQAKLIRSYGVKPEMEIFDSGNLWFAKQLCAEGLVEDPPMFQLCLGIPWGAPVNTQTMTYMVSQLPDGCVWAGFGIGRWEMPMVAQAVVLGGHVRVGLEDNLYLEKGVYASNGSLTERAIQIVELIGAKVASPDEARNILGLEQRGG